MGDKLQLPGIGSALASAPHKVLACGSIAISAVAHVSIAGFLSKNPHITPWHPILCILSDLMLICQLGFDAVLQFIVGLVRPLLPKKTKEFNQAVQELGGQVGSYIPHSSFLVTLSQRRVEDLAALPCECFNHILSRVQALDHHL